MPAAQSNTNAFKVKLSPKVRRDNHDRPVVFECTPDITENRNVNYKTIEPVHMPGAIHVYTNTSSRTYSVSNIKLFSRTTEEATWNLARINLLRAWSMPLYGNNSSTAGDSTMGGEKHFLDAYSKYAESSYPYSGQGRIDGHSSGRFLQSVSGQIVLGKEFLGAPPAILHLSAYSSASRRGNIYKIPTVLTNLSIPYPSDVDYISTQNGVPFPTLMQIDLQLSEVHASNEYSAFSLEAFRNAELTGF